MQTTTRILLLRHAATIRVLSSYSRRIITNTMQTHGYKNAEFIHIYIYIYIKDFTASLLKIADIVPCSSFSI